MAPHHDSKNSERRPTMKDGYIRDRTTGKIIGRMDGNWLRDSTGKLLARYDKSEDRTRDKSGRIVGNGDQRVRQLNQDD